jgi:hypothetical protein
VIVPSVWNRLRRLVVAGLVLGLGPSTLPAQVMRDSSTSWLISAGSEGERYLRSLEVSGIAPATIWSVRPFSSRVVQRIAAGTSAHPWAAQFAERPRGTLWVRAVEPEMTGIFNSRFPYGQNDGPIWAGKGLTASVLGGVEGAAGPLEFRIAPQIFGAQNAGFPLVPNGLTGPQAFGDSKFGGSIDLPQRFGDATYSRIDPGQSFVQVIFLGLAAGVSTGNEAWGPAVESPFLLGVNAAGFGHAFIGTDGPLGLGWLRASVRIIGGRLDQSPYAPVTDHARRYLSGAVVSLGISGVPGLEVGGARLFHNVWPDTGVSLSDLLTPLIKNPFKVRLTEQLGNQGDEPDNQLASVFFRWNVPRSGFELYGEMGREDNAFDTRDYLVEPDRDMSYSLGFQRVWKRPGGELLALRGEVLNSSASHLALIRTPAPPYIHSPVRQGHTQLGQVLGAPGAYGGGAGMLALEWLSSAGRRTITWRRTQREPTDYAAPKDVVHAVTMDWLMFRPRIDLAPEATLAYNVNRDGAGNALNLRAALTGRLHW